MSSNANQDNLKNDINEHINNTNGDKIVELNTIHLKEVNQLKVNPSHEIISRVVKIK
jgi:hypothetical protein